MDDALMWIYIMRLVLVMSFEMMKTMKFMDYVVTTMVSCCILFLQTLGSAMMFGIALAWLCGLIPQSISRDSIAKRKQVIRSVNNFKVRHRLVEV